jgi:drug/metabolite transporter (DMT)-like permease
MPKTLKYSLIMCAAGACYGFVVPLVRTLSAGGLSVMEIMAFQYVVGILVLGAIVALFFRRTVALKDCLKLCGVGVLAAGVSFFYYFAVSLLPSATAVTLLFQFAWMGVALQAIRERRIPRAGLMCAVLIIIIGTVLATGLFEQDLGSTEGGIEGAGDLNHLGILNPLGLACGLLSAVLYTAFLYTSGKVAPALPALHRTLFTTLGSLVIALALCPGFFTDTLSANLTNLELVLPAVILGLAGIVLPVFLIATSAPHLPSSLATIMASTELPASIICVWLFMGDAVSPFVALGVILILGGIVLSQATARRADAL